MKTISGEKSLSKPQWDISGAKCACTVVGRRIRTEKRINSMNNLNFKKDLSKIPTFVGDKERYVEAAYNVAFKQVFPTITITSPCKCDGLFQLFTKNGNIGDVITEYKYDEDMTSSLGRAKVLVQILFYLKMFDKLDFSIPSVVFVGDVNECFVMSVNPLLKYLDFEGVDWNKAPSNAGNNNPDLVLAISNDENLNTWVYDIDDNFDFNEIAEKIKNIIDNVQTLTPITEHNIDRIFKDFDTKVLKKSEKMTANDKVGVFMGCIADTRNYFLHPNTGNVLSTPNGEIAVDSEYFKTFFRRYDHDISPFNKKKLAEICDRLIEDRTRRNKGEFYTPTIWVDYAHERINKSLGENWKEEYVVWDCCWGTGNLTRDYAFSNLYCSTLEQAELDIGAKYNRNSEKFQFDFLNDELKRISQGGKVSDGLMDALESGQDIMFLINTPFATSGVKSTTLGQGKHGIVQTMINKMMKEAKIGRCSENLLAQFLYRIMFIKKQYGVNVSIGLFCNPIFESGSTYAKFREQFLTEFKYEDGFLFNAGHFSNVSSNWGIDFTIWTTGETADKNNFKHDLMDTDKNGKIVKVGEKVVYNGDGCEKISDWIRAQNAKGSKESICLSSGIKTSNRIKLMPIDSLGYFFNEGNSVYFNTQSTGLLTSYFSHGHGVPILPLNFLRCTATFTARKLIENTWINHFDEYLAPDTTNPKYRQFEVDSVVYSLFNSKSQQSSLRNIEYNGKKWNIPNQFFWMSHDEIENLANENRLEETYEQARLAKNTYVYDLINQVYHELSAEAKDVLHEATELVKKSFRMREVFDEYRCSEYQICNWDAGWYQIKALLNEYCRDDLKHFRETYKKLADRMQPLVYELGFLRK